MKEEKKITLKDAVKIFSFKMENDRELLRDYETIVKILQLLFEDEDVEKAFQLNLSEEELSAYVKEVVLSTIGDFMTSDDIHKIDILPNKKISIIANGHFDPDESYSCQGAESVIARKIRIFTGYSVDISL